MAYTIGGEVFGHDSGLTALGDILVRLYRKDTGALVDTTRTDGAGIYSFGVVDFTPYTYFVVGVHDDLEDGIVDVEKTYYTVTYGVPQEIIDTDQSLIAFDVPSPTKNYAARFAVATPDPTTTSGTVYLKNVNWYDKDWLYRVKITVDSSKVSADLTYFPVYVSGGVMNSEFWSNVKGDGTDVIVVNADNTLKLKRELVSIDTGGETMELWVKVPEVLSTSDSYFYLYYGNAAASETNDTDTWDSDFAFVSHMEDLTTSTIKDSTANSNDGTKGAATEPTEEAGKIGDGQYFDGFADWIDLGDIGLGTNAFTLSLWIRDGVIEDDGGVLLSDNYGYSADKGWVLAIYTVPDPDVLFFSVNQNEMQIRVDYSSYKSVWTHITLTKDVDDATVVYINGIEPSYVQHDAWAEPNFPSGESIKIGRRADYNPWDYKGDIDEVRLHKTNRSADWILTSYNTQNDPASFLTIGEEEEASVDSITLNITSGGTYWSIDTVLLTTTNFYIRSGSPANLQSSSFAITYADPDLLGPF